jgi:hypothetical protein
VDDKFLREQIEEMFGPHRRVEDNDEIILIDSFASIGLPRDMVKRASDAGEIRYQEVRKQIQELMLSKDHERHLEAAMYVAAIFDWFQELMPCFQILVYAMAAIYRHKESEPKASI